jgi:ATP-dependent Clp protease adaptor protein ClpS
VFHLDEQSAIRVMLHVHNNGVGVAGVFTREVAETKIKKVEAMAREQEFPLRLTMEPEEEEDE